MFHTWQGRLGWIALILPLLWCGVGLRHGRQGDCHASRGGRFRPSKLGRQLQRCRQLPPINSNSFRVPGIMGDPKEVQEIPDLPRRADHFRAWPMTDCIVSSPDTMAGRLAEIACQQRLHAMPSRHQAHGSNMIMGWVLTNGELRQATHRGSLDQGR